MLCLQSFLPNRWHKSERKIFWLGVSPTQPAVNYNYIFPLATIRIPVTYGTQGYACNIKPASVRAVLLRRRGRGDEHRQVGTLFSP